MGNDYRGVIAILQCPCVNAYSGSTSFFFALTRPPAHRSRSPRCRNLRTRLVLHLISRHQNLIVSSGPRNSSSSLNTRHSITVSAKEALPHHTAALNFTDSCLVYSYKLSPPINPILSHLRFHKARYCSSSHAAHGFKQVGTYHI
jgi:hypothetical protein